ncbi:MAG TPA: TonB-dependent receptor [Steroidobacteraceae bacterium]|jgi:iron complex outermembrane receptor protein|nr:TonB-dependent receptor [Steroidobacteraceae bacterium]
MTVNNGLRLQDLIIASTLLFLPIAAHAQDKSADTTKTVQVSGGGGGQGPPACTPPDVLQNGACVTPKQEEKLNEVVITGSRIARPELDRLEPTIVLGADQFDQRGYTDVGQALSELPAFGIQSSNATNQQTSLGGVAQSFVDLYSLGSQRTLVLIDGRRFVSSNTASLFGGATPPGEQVDLNVVPTKLIDRVETVSVGGAPIYGTDAIAGTVNIIMKKNYEGLDVDGDVGVSNDKDAWNYRARVLGGINFADNRGNITAVAEFSKADGLTGPDRQNFSENLGFLAPATPGTYATVLTPQNAVPQVSTGGVPMLDDFFYLPGVPPSAIGVTGANGQPLAFSGGKLVPYNLGTPTGNPVFWSGGDGIRLSQFSNLLSPLERSNIDTIDNFKINDHINLFAETWFSETHARNLISQPAYNANIFGPAGTVSGMFKISASNPFLSPADQTTIKNDLLAYEAAGFPMGQILTGNAAPLDPAWNANTFYVSRASTDLESGAATATQELYRGVVGLNGDFSIGQNHDYTWEVAVNYGHSEDTFVEPAYVFQNVQNALNATIVGGQIVCAPGYVNSTIKTQSSTCAPLNIFGAGEASQAALAYITHAATAISTNTQRDSTANLSGDIFKLPAGEWKGAVGFENRRESAEFAPDDYFTAIPAQQNVAGPVSGSYISNEVYAETLVPIFEPSQDIPLLHQVEFEGAIRRVDNTFAGKSNTWTEGLRWSPVQDILFRGNRTISIRAPAITELFLPPSTSNEFANDPCDKNFVGQGLVPATRKANCEAAGINTSTFTSDVVNATVKGITSGDPTLAPEKADSYTYGMVLRPRWTPRFNISMDYINIKMSNAIEQLNLVELMDECYDSTDYPNNPACSHFTRNPVNHQVTGYSDGFINAGLLHFQGFTAGLEEIFDLPRQLGTVQFRAHYLDTKTLLLQVGSAQPLNLADTLNQNEATPKGKAVFDLNYLKGPFEWYWQAQYYSMMDFNNQNTPTSQNILSVPRWWLINSTLSYEATKALELRVVVDNVFNKQPPYPALAGDGGNFSSVTSLYFAGIIGRTYLLTVDYRFF